MSIQAGLKIDPSSGYSLFLDGCIPQSYGGSGTVWTDLSSIGNNCSLNGAVTYSNSFPGAGALNFNGSYGVLNDLGLGTEYTSGYYSILIWLKKNNTSDTGFALGVGWNTSLQSVNVGVVGGTPRISTGAPNMTGSGAYRVVDGPTSIAANTWYHICAVKNQSDTMTLYVDGNAVSSGYHPNVIYNTGGASVSYIGRNAHDSNNSYYYFNGSLGQVLVYKNTVLTSEQVRNFYIRTKGRFGK